MNYSTERFRNKNNDFHHFPENSICIKVYIPFRHSTLPYQQALTGSTEKGVLHCITCQVSLNTWPSKWYFGEDFDENGAQININYYFGEESDLFCCGKCRAAYFGTRSQSSLRYQLFQSERGVCNMCRLDCTELLQSLQNTKNEDERIKILLKISPQWMDEPKLLKRLIKTPLAGYVWNADHIKPVEMGGGQCGLDNIQTLCCVCHKYKSGEEAFQRRKRKIKFTDSKM
eukprot:GHVL01019962.1.p1 GENE.GHVL01019962.1~~GHVL01019962.1.p1  ORF type:complete len:229 (-),score=27.40 GHVL01019962.1:265-951(-)